MNKAIQKLLHFKEIYFLFLPIAIQFKLAEYKMNNLRCT